MKNRFVRPLYTVNIVLQSLFDFATPLLIGILIAYLLNVKCGIGAFVYAIFVPLSVAVGGYSMIRFMLASFAALDRIEKQNEQREEQSQNPKT